MRLERALFETSTSTENYLPMVRSTTIARASDALPLAASVDDEQVSHNLQHNTKWAERGCMASLDRRDSPRT